MVSRSAFASLAAAMRMMDHHHPHAFSHSPLARTSSGTSPEIGGGRRQRPRRPRLCLERCDIDVDDGAANDLAEPVAGPPDRSVRDLAYASCGKRPRGSGNLAKGWRTWRTFALNATRDELERNLPVPPDGRRFELLHIRLGIASDVGSNTMMDDADAVALDAYRADEDGNGLAVDSVGRDENGCDRMSSGSGLFGDPGARSGYALGFLFGRAANLADLLFEAWNVNGHGDDGGGSRSSTYSRLPDFWTTGSMHRSDCPLPGVGGGGGNEALGSPPSSSYSVVSLGGGPGFDYVGIALATSFCSYHRRSSSSEMDGGGWDTDDNAPIYVAIFDHEEGWEDVVLAMDDSVNRVLGRTMAKTNCIWGGRCDITRSLLRDPINEACLDLIDSRGGEDDAPRLYVCQYCIGENAVGLRASDHVFFRELFDVATFGSMFVFTEAHPRSWPDFYNLFEGARGPSNYRMEMGFHKNGRRMLLRKVRIANAMIIDDDEEERQRRRHTIISEGDLELVLKFEKIGRLHERNMSSGFRRQVPKIR